MKEKKIPDVKTALNSSSPSVKIPEITGFSDEEILQRMKERRELTRALFDLQK